MPAAGRYVLSRLALLAAAALALLAAGHFVGGPWPVRGGAMLPTLWPGDRILLVRSRAVLPARGDVVIVRTADGSRARRVIGLPGDLVAVRGGRALLNGRPLPRYRVADLILPVSPNLPCPVAEVDGPCRLQRHRETLPDGRAWDVVDGPPVNLPPRTVPAGHVYLLPDHRGGPDSQAIGLVPADALLGRATRILWSVDRPATWRRFWRWGETVRRSRMMKEVERTPAAGLGEKG